MKQHVTPRDWPDETVFIVASGPSVLNFNFNDIAGRRTLAVKDGYLLVPNAEALIIGDHRYARRNPDLSAYLGPLILYTDPKQLPDALADPRIEFIPKVAGRGLSRNPKQLQGTFTTTALAINYAVLRGAKRIGLIGVDGKPGPDNARHFTGTLLEDWHDRYRRQRWGFTRIVDDLKRLQIEVYNLNRYSAINMFPFKRARDI